MAQNAIFIILFSIFAQLVLSDGSSSDVFAVEPQDEPYYVREGQTGPVLPCQLTATYSDRANYEVTWVRYSHGHIRTITKNDKLLDKKSQKYSLISDPSTGNYSLKIEDVQKDIVEGSYHCTVIANDDSGLQFSSRVATVVVLVPPGDPIISETVDESIIEGDTVTVKCMSIGGSPEPTFTWTLPNGTFADAKIFNTLMKDGAAESAIHYRVSAADNGLSLTCAVHNKAMNPEDESKSVISPRLNVLFKPRVHVSPAENVTHLSVEAGEMVNLTCQADANPPAHSYEWKHLSSGERYQAQVWPIRADKAMSGDFECRATNQLGDGSDVLKLNVQYAPQISVPISVSPNEKEKVEIECLVDANPPITEVKWIGPNGFKTDGSTLILKSITREQTGNYTCIATNFLNVYGYSGSQQRVGTGISFVDVKRKPGQAEIEAVKMEVNVGDIIELKCNSPDPGNPRAAYKWASPSSGGEYGSNEHDRETLLVRNAQLSDNGEYRCLPYNELGAGKEATIKITVVEPARISSPLTTERVFTAGESKKTLECEARGYPVPRIIWYKDGKPIGSSEKHEVTTTLGASRCAEDDFCTQTIASSLTMLTPLKWSDKGNYTCIAENGEEDGTWTIIRVLHAPVILNQKFPTKSLAAADLGSQAKLSCVVSARPEPEFHWVFKDTDIQENEKYSLHMLPVRGKPDEYEQILQIENVQADDYADYICRASNGNGGDNIMIELRHTGLPDVPEDLQKVSATPHSLVLQWTPKFGGGYRQMFSIEYRRLNPFTGAIDDSLAEVVEIRNATKIEDSKDDGSIAVSINYNLTGLIPLSTYYIRIRSVNEKGASEYTPMIVASTNDVQQDVSMMSPSKLKWNSEKQIIDIEPKPPVDACTLLYVMIENVWRASDCYSSASPIPNIVSGNQYKARFCMAHSTFQCSPTSPVIGTGSSISWKATTIVPIMFIIFIILSICVFFIVCCRTRAPSKNALKMTPVTLSALPTAETKNAIVHGSQADSGVFTLDSTRMKQQKTYSSNETAGGETWPADDSHYDISNDPYLNEPNGNQIFPPTAGISDQKTESPNVTGSDEEDGRRVMREIIV